MAGIRRWLGLVGLHGIFVVWLTWPLAARLTTSYPQTRNVSEADIFLSAWVLAFESHALVTDPARLLDTNIYYPTPHPLFFGLTFFGVLPIFAPVFWASGNATLAVNVVFLVGLALTSAALHWVVWRWTASHLAGIVAGSTFLLSRWVIWWFVPTSPPYGALWWIPLIVYLVARPLATWRAALAVLGPLVLQALTDLVFVAGAVLGSVTVVAVGRVLRPSTRAAGLRLLAVVGLAVVVLSPVYAGYADVRLREPGLATQSVWLRLRSVTEVPFGLVAENAPMSVPHLTWIVIALGAGLIAARRRTAGAPAFAWRHATLWVAVGAVLSVDFAAIPGVGVFRMPLYAALAPFGISVILRMPARFAVGALIGTSLLAGLASAELFRRIQGRGGRIAHVGPALAALLIVGLMYRQCRSDGTVPDVYPVRPTLRASPITEALRAGTGPVLELPIGSSDAAAARLHSIAMLRSTHHWRPLLNGYASYYPAAFRTRMELARRLPDPDALRALRETIGLAHLVVNLAGFPPAERAAWTQAALRAGSGLRPVARDANMV
ncbi:MAG: hypothetical protein ACREQL_14720, partial [Candidatus Binatia bacterium]